MRNAWQIMVAALVATMIVSAGCDETATAPSVAPKTVVSKTTSTPAAVPAAGKVPAAYEAFAKTATVPTMFVPLVSKAPAVDGTMDAAYAACPPASFKFLAGGDSKPVAATTVWSISTKTHLYVFFKCQSPDMDALLADVKEHDGSVWNDDSVELFIDPTNKREIDGYSHIAVNALGTTAESRGPAGAEDYSWDPKLTVKTVKGKKDWTVEMAIPFVDLVKDPSKLNKVWAVNFNRMAFLLEGNEDTAWSPTGGTSSHVPSQFGAVWLDAGSVDNSK